MDVTKETKQATIKKAIKNVKDEPNMSSKEQLQFSIQFQPSGFSIFLQSLRLDPSLCTTFTTNSKGTSLMKYTTSFAPVIVNFVAFRRFMTRAATDVFRDVLGRRPN